ncbi:MAG TPA: flagellar cap protein FliD N-terminal domain-containing protein, partial [Candidatus Paceibacterota bacterium]|nr:flagellar cap protein FliD N-terminal domain-containing protein [Candidatus Paceibacterota bacterium]
MNLGISGLASGFDWQSLVEQIMEVERAPQRTLRADQTKIQQRNEAYTSIKSQLQTLQTKAQALKEASLFDSRAPAISDSTIASATSSPGAIQGAFSFHITQLATAAVLQGASNVGANLHSTDITASSPEPDSSPTLENAGFALPVTGGTFTLNGKTVTVSTTDTLRQVFNKIKTETGIDASYDSETDTISLSSANPIVVGGPNDTSNFLSAARLYFNNTGSITSSVALGAAKPNAALSEGNFNTAILDGGSGAGEFKINGVSITFNATEDGLANVLTRINESNAGVVATYDAVNDRLQLTNKNTGDSGVALEDVTGNFLAATGLTAGTLQRGKNLTYTLNNGGTLTSASNTITEESSGLT